MDRSARTILGAMAVAVVLSAAMGCGSNGSSDDDVEEPEVASVDVGDLATFALPLDHYRVTEDRARLLSDAFETLFMRCMRRLGFTEQPPRPDEASGPEGPVGNERLYMLVDEGLAETWGYHLPYPEGVDPAEGISPEDYPELSSAWQAAAVGNVAQTEDGQEVPEGGCDGEANRALAEGTPSDVDVGLADRLAVRAYEQAQQDSRVRAAFGAWSDCMRSAGFGYSTPIAANDDEAWATEVPTPREIAVATADVACKDEVGLIAVWAAVHVAYEQVAIEDNAEALALLLEYRETEERNAIAALDG